MLNDRFQDPLSALDAHVGKAVFQNIFRDRSSKKTRILVTHALHFLPHVDYIYVMTDGRFTEHGTYADLMASNGEFSRFITEFGAREESSKDGDSVDDDEDKKEGNKFIPGAGIMQAEERNVGAVSASVYRTYLSAGKGIFVVPLLLFSLVFLQGATIMWSYWSVSMLQISSLLIVLLSPGLCIGKRCTIFFCLIGCQLIRSHRKFHRSQAFYVCFSSVFDGPY
jgi:hypothetical protein